MLRPERRNKIQDGFRLAFSIFCRANPKIVTFPAGHGGPLDNSSRTGCGPRAGRCAPLIYIIFISINALTLMLENHFLQSTFLLAGISLYAVSYINSNLN